MCKDSPVVVRKHPFSSLPGGGGKQNVPNYEEPLNQITAGEPKKNTYPVPKIECVVKEPATPVASSIKVCVHLPKGGEKALKVCDNEEQLKQITVGDLKKKLNQEMKTVDDFRIIYETKTLEDETTLASAGIKHMSTVKAVLRLSGGRGRHMIKPQRDE